jgi:L-alanine-DL-glutamate epimerase-like enolase superfamily enzyme
MRPAKPELHAEVKTLHLTTPFRIAHGVSSERQVLRVSYGKAMGEAPFVPYYHEDPTETLRWIQELDWNIGPAPQEGPKAGRLALDVLWHDWLGRRDSKPVWQLLGIGTFASASACRSFSIPSDLDEFKELVANVNRQFRVLKLKLGSGNIDFDEAIAAYAHEAAPNAKIFADANGGWSVADASTIIPRLLRRDIAFVEQPVHHERGTDIWRELRSALPSRSMPLFADESAQSAADVDQLAELADGVNVKILKCGGLRQAVTMIERARACRVQVMLGCMIESSIGVTAAAHLAPLADWIDLDGHLYLADDDSMGLNFDDAGELNMPKKPGIGAAIKPISPEERNR